MRAMKASASKEKSSRNATGTARIREKKQARLEYDNAKKEGKTTALLEQHPEVLDYEKEMLAILQQSR